MIFLDITVYESQSNEPSPGLLRAGTGCEAASFA